MKIRPFGTEYCHMDERTDGFDGASIRYSQLLEGAWSKNGSVHLFLFCDTGKSDLRKTFSRGNP